MRSNSGSRHTLGATCLANKVEELTQAASVIHQELGDSTTANVGVVVEPSVLERNRSSATPWIDEHTLNSCAVKVTTVKQASRLVEEHND